MSSVKYMEMRPGETPAEFTIRAYEEGAAYFAKNETALAQMINGIIDTLKASQYTVQGIPMPEAGARISIDIILNNDCQPVTVGLGMTRGIYDSGIKMANLYSVLSPAAAKEELEDMVNQSIASREELELRNSITITGPAITR